MLKKNMSNGGIVEQSAHPAQAICRIGLQLGRSRWTLILGATVILIAQVIVTLGTVAAAPNNNLIDPQHPLLDTANTLPVVSDVNKSGAENNVLTFLDSDFESAFYDPDGDTLKKIRINSLPVNGTLRVNGNPAVVQQEINANLADHMTFSPDAGWSGTTSFSWNGSDNEGYAEDPALVNITIQSTNIPPVIDLNGGAPGTGDTAIFNSGAGPVRITSDNLDISDSEDAPLQSATVRILNRPDGTAELLAANLSETNITLDFDSAAGVLTLLGPDTIANFENVLRTVTYQNTSSSPTVETRQISFSVSDGQLASNTAVATVQLLISRIALGLKPGIQTVLSGHTAFFTVTITNTGNVELSRLTVDAPQAPACENAFTQLAVDSLVVGQSVGFTCSRLYVTAQAHPYEVVVTITAVDAQDNPVSAEDNTQVQIVARPVEHLLLPVINNGYVAGEPNNRICQAQPIALNLDTFFLPDDPDDWYRFTLTQPGNLTVTLSDFTPVDGQIVLYRGRCAAPIMLKNNGNSETVKVVELGLQPAGYYLIWIITDRNFSSTRPYKLHIKVTES